MSARSSARVTVMLLAAGAAPAAGAAELGQMPAALEAAANASASISFPIFLDASRFVLMQAAWRSRIDGAGARGVAPLVAAPGEPEVETLNEARRTLSRGEEVSLKAIAVRARAEELSRRFAVSVPGESAPEVPAGITPDTALAEDLPAESTSVHETASSEPAVVDDAAPAAASSGLQTVSASTNTFGGDMAPVSMLGGPRVEKASAEDAAPVIEDMATTKAGPVAKRAVAAPATAASRKLVRETYAVAVPSTPPKPDTNGLMPTELRAFGWNAQP